MQDIDTDIGAVIAIDSLLIGNAIDAGIECFPRSDPPWPHLRHLLSWAGCWREFQEEERPSLRGQRCAVVLAAMEIVRGLTAQALLQAER